MLNFSFPTGVDSNCMLKLASGINQENSVLFRNVKLPELPPRDINTILKLTAEGKGGEISVLEWVTLLNGKEKWDAVNAGRARATNQLIWQTAINHHGLRYLLYWRITLFLDGQDRSLAKGLVQLFKEFQSTLSRIDRQRTTLINGFQTKSFDQLCKLALSLKATPKQVLNKCGLPGKTQFSTDCIKEIPRFWAKSSADFSLSSMLTLAKKLTLPEQDLFYSAAMTDIPVETLSSHKLLITEILRLYQPAKPNSRYMYLSPVAKKVIQELIGLMSFEDFKRLIDKMTSPDISTLLNLADWEIRQLHARVAFWSNYHKKLFSFSVYLPKTIFALLSTLDFNIDGRTLQELSSGDCEVCILEFSEFTVIEFLRGSNSGLRIIRNSEQSVRILKDNNIRISQQQLESIPYIAEHDHLVYWQKSCEQMLRTKFKITPNTGIKKFLITGQSPNGRPFVQEYSLAFGLPELTKEQMSKRFDAILKRKMYETGNHRYYDDSDFLGYENSYKIAQVCRNILSKYEYWVGFSRTHGWVSLDRRSPQSGNAKFKLFRLSDKTYIECSRVEWNPPEYNWAPAYFSGDRSYSEMTKACLEIMGLYKNIERPEVVKEFLSYLSKD